MSPKRPTESVDGLLARHYRLRGEVDGALRTFALAFGENRIGSLRSNAIVLSLQGVSREHALVDVGEDGLTAADLGSKNGTYVNGERIKSARIGPGDEIRLGPVTLTLEELEAGDAELAISIDAPDGSGAMGPVREDPTFTVAARDNLPFLGWVRLVERFMVRMSGTSGPDLAGALGDVLHEVGARGACLLEWPLQGEPVVLASAGEVDLVVARRLAEEVPAKRASCVTSLAGENAPVATCVHRGAGGGVVSLVAWGDFPGRVDSAPLFQGLVRIVARSRPREVVGAAPEASRRPAGLEFPPGYVPGRSPSMASVYQQLQPLLQGDMPVLIVGETGVGKEYIARILHGSSDRKDGPFVAVNCAAIPAELLEAEMFGIQKGVATGVEERTGKFQTAGGGILLFDEIGDMSLALQAKLLRALQEKEIHPVGARAPVPVDVRVVAATNADLKRNMEEERFRRDLYYRVAGYVLDVPPLRERRDDIPLLVEHLIRRYAGKMDKAVRGITINAMQMLLEHGWPGNIRELDHEIRRAVVQCSQGEAIEAAMLSDHLLGQPGDLFDAEDADTETSLDLDERTGELERRLITRALARTGGNRSQAARLLGISRNGLAIKMKRLGIPG